MAGKRTLEFEILAETKKVTKDLSNMRGELGKLDKSIKASQKSGKEINQSFDSFGKTISSLTKQLGALAVAYLSIEGAKSLITTTAEVESGFIGIAKTTGLVGEEFALLEQGILDLSTEMAGVSVSGLQSVAETAGQLGISGVDNILEFTRVITMIGTATDLSAEQAAIGMAKLGNSLSVPIEEFENLGSVINELSNNTTATAENLLGMSQRVSGVGKTFGLSADEILAFSATLVDVGMSAELGGTAISEIMLKMLKDVEGFAKASGVSFDEFQLLIKKEPVEALELFIASIGKLDKASKIDALDELGLKGSGVTQTMLKLASNTDALSKNLKIAGDEWKENTSLMTEYEVASEGIDAQWTKVTNSLTILAYEIGKELLPVLKEMIDTTVKWVKSLDKSAIEGFGKALADLIGIMGDLVNAALWLNDILIPDWMTGKDDAGVVDTVLSGWSQLFEEVGKSATTMGNKLNASGEQWDRLTERAEESKNLINQANMFDGSLKSFNKLQDAMIGTSLENKKLVEEWKKKDPEVYAGLINNLTYKTKLLEESFTKLKTIKPHEEQIKSTDEATKSVETLTTTTKKLTEEEIKALDKLNKQRVKDHTKALKTLEKDEEKLTKEILKANEKLAKDLAGIEDDRLKSKVDIQGQISELERSGLSDKDAYYKKEEDADKLVSDAKRALIDGDLEAYRTYFEAAKSLIDENGDKAITKNGAILVSADEVRKNSIDSLKELSGLEDQYYDKKKSMAQMEHDQKISFKKMEIELVKLNIEAELELIKLSSQPKGTPLDTTALDSVLAKIDGLKLGLSTLREMPVKLNVDSQPLDEVPAKVEALKMTLNGITMTVNADTTPADFGIDKMVTDASGKEIVMSVNPEWEKAEKEIEKSLKPKPVEVPVKVDAKSFSKEVDTAKATAQTPVVTPVQADTTQAQSQVRVLKAAIALPSSFLVVVDASSAVSVIAQLKVPTSSTHTVYVDKVYNNASGGYAGEPLNRAEGGSVYRTIPHGKIPGHDLTGRDDVRVNATRGEYFLNVGATDYAGDDFLNALNAKLIPQSSINALMASTSQSLATGGEVGTAPARNISLNFMDDNGAAMETMTDEMTASKIEKYFRKYAK